VASAVPRLSAAGLACQLPLACQRSVDSSIKRPVLLQSVKTQPPSEYNCTVDYYIRQMAFFGLLYNALYYYWRTGLLDGKNVATNF